MARPKGGPRLGGRKKGTPNKQTAALKDAILEAAAKAGGKQGLVGYLEAQAGENPASFMALLGKVLPLQIAGQGDKSGALVITWGGPVPHSHADD